MRILNEIKKQITKLVFNIVGEYSVCFITELTFLSALELLLGTGSITFYYAFLSLVANLLITFN